MISKKVDVECPECERASTVTLQVEKDGSSNGVTKYSSVMGHVCPKCKAYWDKIEVIEYKDGEIEAVVLPEK